MPTGSVAFLELPIALGFGPATGPTLKTALCHIRTLVGRRINTARTLDRHALSGVLLCPVVGRSRPAVIACCTVRSGVFHHWIHHLWPQGAVPPGFNPATGPTLKTALCHIRTLVGRRINTAHPAGTMADLGPLIRHLVSTRLPSGGRAAFLSPLSPLDGTRPCV